MRKLENTGFDKYATNIIENRLCKITQTVVLNGRESDWITLKRRVQQGNIIVPQFFYIYLNDLAKIIEDCAVVQHADDAFVFASMIKEFLSKIKQHNIYKIIDYFTKSQLVVNKQLQGLYIVYSSRKSLRNAIMTVDNKKIAESTSVKYFGVVIDSKLKFYELRNMLHRMVFGIKVFSTLS